MWIVYEKDDENDEIINGAGPFDTEAEAEEYRVRSGGDGILEVNPPQEGHAG
jgi:hypothetical protein